MVEIKFGRHEGFLSRAADVIARKHGARHVNCQDGGRNGAKRGWFAVRSGGEAADQQVAAAVLADVEKAGGFSAIAR